MQIQQRLHFIVGRPPHVLDPRNFLNRRLAAVFSGGCALERCLHLVDKGVLRRVVQVALTLHRLVQTFLGNVLHLEDTVALLNGLLRQKGRYA